MQSQGPWSEIPPETGSSERLGDATRSACLHCRTKKVRCTVSPVAGVCERCYRSERECVLRARSQRRPNKKVTLRIEELEKNLAVVRAQLAGQGPQSQTSQSPSSNGIPTPSALPVLQTQPSSSAAQQDVFDRGLLSLSHGMALIREYQTMSKGFAFVVLPELQSLPAVRQESPVTLLAVLAVASWQNRDVQTSLYRELWQILSQQLFMDGELCLDVLQALIILSAWCHLNLVSVYRLTAYAASIVVDLGINSVPRKESDPKVGLRLKFYPRAQMEVPERRSFEAQRAYVGCYLLSTSYSLLSRKPLQLRYTPYLEQCAAFLALENNATTDDSLIHYVRILHHAEEIYEAFGYAESHTTAQYSDEILRILLKTYDTRLKTLKSELPSHIRVQPEFVIMVHTICAYTNEVALHCLPPPGEQLSPTLVEAFLDCLVSVREVLDYAMLLSDRDFMNLNGYSCARIHYAVTLAYRLTFAIRSPSWDVNYVRSIVKLEDYIDLLIQRVEPIQKCVSGSEDHSSWYNVCLIEWTSVRKAYIAELAQRGIEVPLVVTAPQETAVWSQGVLPYNDTGFFDFMPNLQQWMWAPPVPDSS
ncbi:uncharacterized protein M421DRAFT_270390 [Didymella exigua CBS 183.55]|uniref:Zn(2)-C6 fungal-type domain-containing protein n=1 Tax=Didymella exigua CBS 183.55 TaxID=1150837 RepID=A0A6A5RDV7_9PLEO|nr:uncharacterized protein M421DRAFT_270390 [Didymella exigua CBS 183.55]KAF1924756.1 hypothetical protein M421DRAFT_270390 [Didymella exigua CBS 183.55]